MLEAVLFDLDGTLVDSLDDLTAAANYAVGKFGYKERTREEIRRFIGNGADMLLKRAMDGNDEHLDEALEVFKGYYSKNMLKNTRPYEGICGLLKELKRKNIKVAVVSNKPDYATNKICETLFEGLVDTAVGSDLKKRRKKPYPDAVELALETLSADKNKAVYIGDSDVDALTAKNADMKHIAVLWGFRKKEEIHGAEKFAEDVDRLKEYLDELDNE